MLAIQLPALLAVIVPIVVIEAWFLQRRTSLSWGRSFSVTSISNLLSTVIGVPLTWFLLFGIQLGVFILAERVGVDGPAQLFLLPFSAPWLPPVVGMTFWWMVAGAALLLSVPYYFVSVYSESWIICRLEPALAKDLILKIQKRSHIVTYSLMYCASIVAAWLMK